MPPWEINTLILNDLSYVTPCTVTLVLKGNILPSVMILYKAKSINIKSDPNSGKRLAFGGNNAQKTNYVILYVKIDCQIL